MRVNFDCIECVNLFAVWSFTFINSNNDNYYVSASGEFGYTLFASCNFITSFVVQFYHLVDFLFIFSKFRFCIYCLFAYKILQLSK